MRTTWICMIGWIRFLSPRSRTSLRRTSSDCLAAHQKTQPGARRAFDAKRMKQAPDIFARLRNGETISFEDPEYSKLRDVSFATRKLLLKLNQATEPEEMRALLSRITDTEIDESTAIFPPFHVNFGKHTKIGKNVFINFDCVFLDFGGITIEDGVFIAPKASLLSEGHPLAPESRHS